MNVRLRGVNMHMCVGVLGVNYSFMRMLMMFIMRMTMGVFKYWMLMGMTMPLGEMQPHTDAHQQPRN